MNIILKIILHLFFWIVFIVLSGVVSFQMGDDPEFIYKHYDALLVAITWAVVAFYFFYFFLYRFIEKHEFFKYFIFSVLSVGAISVVFILLVRVFIFTDEFFPEPLWDFTTIAGTYTIANCGSLLRGFIRWIESAKIKSELEKRNILLELEALRTQINQHFLFNTLNNIDSYIFTNPEKASKMLITLSETLRYMLYETQEGKNTIAQENKHIENVLELQRIRFSHENYIVFRSEIENPVVAIAPLLFIPFVENACKYAQFLDTYPVIKISLKQQSHTIVFECVNTYNDVENSKLKKGGLGLENVQKRLSILYPDSHTLEIKDSGSVYFVKLVITTA
ncbi:MAG: sensor histidine kinase [Bacteroidales bacterium]|nr:sensor histidine kinase [Bacteroidales bacterium]